MWRIFKNLRGTWKTNSLFEELWVYVLFSFLSSKPHWMWFTHNGERICKKSCARRFQILIWLIWHILSQTDHKASCRLPFPLPILLPSHSFFPGTSSLKTLLMASHNLYEICMDNRKRSFSVLQPSYLVQEPTCPCKYTCSQTTPQIFLNCTLIKKKTFPNHYKIS